MTSELLKAYDDSVPFADAESPYLFDLSKTSLSAGEVIRKYTPLPRHLALDSVPMPGSQVSGFSHVYRNKALPVALKLALSKELDTVYGLFRMLAETYADQECFATRKYNWLTRTPADEYSTTTYREVDEKKRHYGAGVLHLLQNSPFKNPKIESHAKIDRHHLDFASYNEQDPSFIFTIYASNREEWTLSDIMCASYSITSTALYDTLGEDSSLEILQLTQSPVVATSRNHISTIINLKINHPEQLEALISLISFDSLDFTNPGDAALYLLAQRHNIALYDLDRVVETGRLFPSVDLAPNPKTPFTISFTSGTSGSKAKGVVLIHEVAALAMCFSCAHLPVDPDTRSFAFLPLAHIFEREMVLWGLTRGALIGYPFLNAQPTDLVDCLSKFKPTRMANVPRVLTKFEAVIKAATVDSDSAIKSKLFGYVFDKKIQLQSQADGAQGKTPIADAVLLSKLRKAIGFDNMESVVVGSAPINPSTIKFLKAALNCGLLQGYGLTESFAGFAVSDPYEKEPGSCGPTSVTVEMKLRDIPEMGYTSTDEGGPRGELLLRGPQVFHSYYRNEEETTKAVDSEGWFHTGDIARIHHETGRLYIIDRVKSFFKLSQGEYVTPEKVETKYLSDNSLLQQCFVYGHSLQSYLVGVLGVEPQQGIQFLVKNGVIDRAAASQISPNKVLEYLNRRDIRQKLVSFINSNVTLQGFEKLHNVHVLYEPLSMANNTLTPTVKVKRPFAFKLYQKEIELMYEEGSLIRSSKL